MMFLSLFKKPNHEISLIFDIGNGSVGCALAKLSHDDKPKIFYTTRTHLNNENEIDPKTLEDLTMSALQKTCQKVQKEGMSHLTFTEFKTGKIERVFFTFSSPWYLSKTATLHIDKEVPFIFNEQTIETALQHEKLSFIQSLQGAGSGTKNSLELAERNIMQIKLNGYETANPFGKRAKNATFSLYMSLIPVELSLRVKEIVGRFFHFKSSHSYSFSHISHKVLQDIFPMQNDFFFVDISDEITDISLVKNGVLTETFSFPQGRMGFIRSLKDTQRNTPELCSSLLSLHYNKKADEKTEEKVKKVISESKAKWESAFKDGLAHLGNESYLPETVYFTAENDVSPAFAESIEEMTLRPFPIDSQTLKAHCQTLEKAGDDPFLALEAIFLNKAFKLNQF